MTHQDADIVVIGGGHAGVEAALAVSRMGRRAILVTMDRHKLALMSCNPAVGGLGKSHLVKEVDALGGIIGRAADEAGIQFRRLNRSRGPAVWATRIQADRRAYTNYVSEVVAADPNVELVEGIATGFRVDRSGAISGVVIGDGRAVSARAAVLCSGTFLGGLIHLGDKQIPAGRRGEPAALGLSDSLQNLGFEVGRLKTGTPPRLDGQTIDYDRCFIQPGEDPPPRFSSESIAKPESQIPCYLTYTSPATKQLIQARKTLSPMFSGQIDSRGPRYCPSIEDKFHRFADKERHQIFLEPEGNGTDEIYPSGFSTALPEDVQREAVRTIIGLEEAVVTEPGYAIEYDYCPARQIKPSLETRLVPGLFFAGQINGTSGYEEAAGQGLLAGVNAVMYLAGGKPLVLSRTEAYLGVMVDDLTTRSTTEPYRMFTSRAEYRLALREDNARDRLHRYACEYGLISPESAAAFEQTRQATKDTVSRYRKIRVPIAALGSLGERFKKVDQTSLENVLRQPHIDLDGAVELAATLDTVTPDDREVLYRAAIQIRYAGYLAKQQREIDKTVRLESVAIPERFPYRELAGLKTEAAEKLSHFKPSTLGQAGRLEGVTPGDVAVLAVHLKRLGATMP